MSFDIFLLAKPPFSLSVFGKNRLGNSSRRAVCVVVRLYAAGTSGTRRSRHVWWIVLLYPVSSIQIACGTFSCFLQTAFIRFKTLHAKLHVVLKQPVPHCKMTHLFASFMVHADLLIIVVTNVHDSLQPPPTTGTNVNISFWEGFQTILKLFYSEPKVGVLCCFAAASERQGHSPILQQLPVPTRDASRAPFIGVELVD